MKKFKTYKGEHLFGSITLKIDGVQSICKDGVWTSRKDKPLYNLPPMPDGIYEYFHKDWSTSVSDVRTHEGKTLLKEHLYRLDVLDERLFITGNIKLTPSYVKDCFDTVISHGNEGLVIVTEDYNYKVKKEETYDIKVIGYQPGTGKYTGKMGALLTEQGKVGTGFNDAQREEFTEEFILGQTIEVTCMGITEKGKFRHPRFIRLREDK